MADWVIPQGISYFNAPIVMEDVDGVTWRGYGGSKVSRLVYVGPPTKAFIQIVGSSRCTLRDFEIVIDKPGVDAAVLVCNAAVANPNGRISTNNLFDNVRVMHGGKPTAAKYGFSVDSQAMGGTVYNNEHHEFRRCYVQSATQACYYLSGHQAHQTIYDRCIAHDAGGRRPIGLLCDNGAYFRWQNGAFAHNSIDIKTTIQDRYSVVSFCSSEGSTQAYVSGSVGAGLSIDNWRWDCTPEVGKPVVKYFGNGPVTIRDSCFAGTNGVCPTMEFDGFSNSYGTVDLSGLTIRQHLGTVPVQSLISVRSGWDYRKMGVKHQRIAQDGTIVTTPILMPPV